MNKSNYWDAFDQAEREESGGGGIVCQAVISTGYKVYATGVPQEDTFFEAPAGDKAARGVAKSEALALASEHGLDRAQWSVQIRALKDTAVRVQDGEWKGVTWQGDRFWVQQTWTQAAKEVMIPSFRENITGSLPATVWCRLGFQPNPYNVAQGDEGKTDKNQAGKPRFPQVCYVTEVFADKAAVQEAIGVNSGESAPASSGPAVPEAWAGSEEAWEAAVAKLKAEGPAPVVLARLKALTAEQLASEVAATIPEIEAWL